MTVKIIIIRESFWQSVRKDLVSGAVLVASTGIGWALKITALEWVGALIFIIFLVSHDFGGERRLTIHEARQMLDEIETQSELKETDQ